MTFEENFTSESYLFSKSNRLLWQIYGGGRVSVRLDLAGTLKLDKKFGSPGILKSIAFGNMEIGWIVGSASLLEFTTEGTYPGEWNVVDYPASVNNSLNKVVLYINTITNIKRGFLFGNNSEIYEWDGINWLPHADSGNLGADIKDFWISPDGSCGYGVGSNGLLFSWEASSDHFLEMMGSKTLTTETINSIWCIKNGNTDEAYAVGNKGLFMQFIQRKGWKVLQIFTGEGGKNLYDIHMISTTEGWAVGEDSMILTYESTKATWEVSSQAGSFGGDLLCVWGTTKDNVWAGGEGGLLIHYDGHFWQQIYAPGELTDADITDCYFPLPTYGFLITSKGEVFYFNGHSFKRMNTNSGFTSNNLTAVDWSEENKILITDDKGNIWEYDLMADKVNLLETLSDTDITKIKKINFNEGYLLANGKIYFYNGVDWNNLLTNVPFSSTISFSTLKPQKTVFLGNPSPPLTDSYLYTYETGVFGEMNGGDSIGVHNWVSVSMYQDDFTFEGYAISQDGHVVKYSGFPASWNVFTPILGVNQLRKVQTLYPQIIYAAGGVDGIYKYKNGSWNQMVGLNLNDNVSDFIMLEEGEGFLVGQDDTNNQPIFYYSQNGVWNKFSSVNNFKFHSLNSLSMWNKVKGIAVGDYGMVYLVSAQYHNYATFESKTVLSIEATDPDPLHQFYSVKLVAQEELNGGKIDYYVSVDNGVNWEKVANGLTHYFSESHRGRDLKWKAVIYTSSDRKESPVLKNVYLTAYDEPGVPSKPGKPQHFDDANQGWDNDKELYFSWEASTSPIGVDHYEIWVSENEGAFRKVTDSLKTYVNLQIGVERHSYKIEVVPVNPLGIKGETSEISDLVVVDTVPPTKPVVDKPNWGEINADYITVHIVTKSKDLNFDHYEIKGGLLGDTYLVTGETREFTFQLKQNATQNFYIRGVDKAGNKGNPEVITVTENSSVLIGQTNAPYHVDDTARTGYDDDGEVEFEWQRNDDPRTTGYWVYYARNHGQYYKYKKVIQPKVTIYGMDGDEISVKIAAINEYGDEGVLSDPSPWIEIDLQSPKLELVEPDPKEEINLDDFEYFLFKISECVDKTPIEKGQVFSLYDENNGLIELEAVYKDSQDLIYLYPKTNLKHGKEYHLVINTALIQDKAGRKVENIDDAIVFKTQAAGKLNVKKFLPYPNPSTNGSAQIYFTLNQDVIDTKLEIYSLSGKKIMILRDGPIFEGENFFYWDGTDKYGNNVPNGTYFLKLIVKWNNGTQVKENEYYSKLMVIK